tara:strand:- start:10 stop:288 length:279 start_codon:yes stop_codon:yes gene_type:complete
MDGIRKNGVPLSDTEYQLGSLQEMTKEELIEEILGTHSWDYLLENGMVMLRCECEIPTMEEAIFRECEGCLEQHDMAVVNGYVVNEKGEVMK